MRDLDIIKLWVDNVKIDLPYQRFMLHTIGGLSLEETEEIIKKITPETLVEIYKNEE